MVVGITSAPGTIVVTSGPAWEDWTDHNDDAGGNRICEDLTLFSFLSVCSSNLPSSFFSVFC